MKKRTPKSLKYSKSTELNENNCSLGFDVLNCRKKLSFQAIFCQVAFKRKLDKMGFASVLD